MAAAADQLCLPSFHPVARHFRELAERQPFRNQALAVVQGGQLVAHLWSGPDYDGRSLQSLFSAGKSAAVLVIAHLVDRGQIDPAAPVATYWPGFAAAGKQTVTVAQLLSHQAGLVGLPGGFSRTEFLEHQTLAERLAGQPPAWPVGTAHGYHAFTFGTLTEELVRRVTGRSLNDVFRDAISKPRGVDVFLGLPETEEHRLVPVTWEKAPTRAELLGATQGLPLAQLAYNVTASDFPEIAGFSSERALRAAPLHAVSAVGSALGLAQLFGCLSVAALGGPLLSPGTLRLLADPVVEGPDLVLQRHTCWSLGMVLPTATVPLLGPGSFGHDGTGGCVGAYLAAADLAVGFTTDMVRAREPSPGNVLLTCAAECAGG